MIFRKEFSRAVPNITIKDFNVTKSGCVILSPATPEDFSRIMNEDWSKHVSLGNDISASISKNKQVEYQAVVLGVDPDLDDQTLKEELEERNSLKLTSVSRLFHKNPRTKTWKIMITLENEDTQKQVLRHGVHIGYKHHNTAECHEKNKGNRGISISQCYNCQEWDPGHRRMQCDKKRACVWCSEDHFHKECPHFQKKDRTHAKCANCKEAHPAWSHECVAYQAATSSSTKATAVQVVRSNSITRTELDTEMQTLRSNSITREDFETQMQTAIANVWKTFATVMSTVVSRAVLELEDERKKPRPSMSELVRKNTANTVKAIMDCGLLPPNMALEVTEVQRNVWKDIYPQDEYSSSSQGSATPHSNKPSQPSK